jgi:hypothetical protein
MGNGQGLVGFYVPDTAPGRACCFVGAELDATTLALRSATGPPLHHILIDFDESPDGSLRCQDAFRMKEGPTRTSQVVVELLLLRRVKDDAPPRVVVPAQVQGDCTFSPDGKWIAYTNRDGLFVTRATLDTAAATYKLVPGVTSQARWMPNGKAIVYRDGRGLYILDVRVTGDAVDGSEPRLMFERDGLFTTWDVWGNGWDIGLDGRFLVVHEPTQPSAPQLRVITNLDALAAQRFGASTAR